MGGNAPCESNGRCHGGELSGAKTRARINQWARTCVEKSPIGRGGPRHWASCVTSPIRRSAPLGRSAAMGNTAMDA